MSKKLKLRGAARFTIIGVSKDPIQRNETVEVSDEIAEGLLKQVVYDRANTPWPVWEDVTPEGAAEVKKSATKTRRRRKTAPKADEAAA